MKRLLALWPALCLSLSSLASAAPPPRPLFDAPLRSEEDAAAAIREHYTKFAHRIPMRDGARLFTHVFIPKDRSRTYPILLVRTPYGVYPYGVDNYPTLAAERRAVQHFAPAPPLIRSGFIFVQQDVRGRMMSEGTFVDVRPVVSGKGGRPPKGAAAVVDESTDAWDTIDWLVRNVPGNNGRVGAWGGSYLGFYAALAAINAHPALKAVSPQAPVTDWFQGDDFRHNGALLLADAVLFMGSFGRPRPKPVAKWPWDFEPEMGDLYDYFLELGPLANVNARLFNGTIGFWNDMMAHQTRDAFWQARDPRPHLRDIKPAMLTVGGWFDAEDVYGTLATYRAIEAQSPGTQSALVMGPWVHNGWMRTEGDALGDVRFASKTSHYYRERVITPFFLRHLKGEDAERLPEATVFETGTNQWRGYDAWPPRGARPQALWLCEGGRLALAPYLAPAGRGRPDAGAPCAQEGGDSYVSDPARPVPHSPRPLNHRDNAYMVDDQRFAARRPDVLTYATEPLAEDLLLAGPLQAELRVKTTGTDADFVVKLIDVYPADVRDPDPNPSGVRLAGYQQLVRGEVLRGRFRESFERPVPFAPGQAAALRFPLPDVNHVFRAGHRLMVQVQSSWFPLVDRNPQTFVDIAAAQPADFRAATHTLLRGGAQGSRLQVTVMTQR